jgi:hypothetical protein
MTHEEYRRRPLRDLRMSKFVTTREINSGAQSVPVGTVVSVIGKANGLTISAEACPHCGVSVYMRKVSPHDLREILADEIQAN